MWKISKFKKLLKQNMGLMNLQLEIIVDDNYDKDIEDNMKDKDTFVTQYSL